MLFSLFSDALSGTVLKRTVNVHIWQSPQYRVLPPFFMMTMPTLLGMLEIRASRSS